jgi:hypothetical protein
MGTLEPDQITGQLSTVGPCAGRCKWNRTRLALPSSAAQLGCEWSAANFYWPPAPGRAPPARPLQGRVLRRKARLGVSHLGALILNSSWRGCTFLRFAFQIPVTASRRSFDDGIHGRARAPDVPKSPVKVPRIRASTDPYPAQSKAHQGAVPVPCRLSRHGDICLMRIPT